MRLRVPDPCAARFVGARVTMIFPEQDNGGVMMPDLARRRVNGILEVSHDLVNASRQRLGLAGVDHLGKVIDTGVAYRRFKPAFIAQRANTNHRGIIKITE